MHNAPDIVKYLENAGKDKLTFPPGMVGEIAKYIHDQSRLPIMETAISTGVIYYAGKVGRTYNVAGMGLNQYIVFIGPSGIGKNGIATGVSELDNAININLPHDVFIRKGPEGIPSMQGLRNRLAGVKKDKIQYLCCASITPDVGLWFQGLYDDNADQNKKNIRQFLLNLYTSSGGKTEIGAASYADEFKDVPAMVAPAWSWLAEATPETFYPGINEQSTSEGLTSRLQIIEYVGKIPKTNFKHKQVVISEDIKQHLHNLLIRTVQYENWCDLNRTYIWRDVPFDEETTEWNIELDDYLRDKRDKFITDGRGNLNIIWSRVIEKVYRLAALLAVGVDWYDPLITQEEYLWAIDFTIRCTNTLINRLEKGELGQQPNDTEQRMLFERAMRKYTTEYINACAKDADDGNTTNRQLLMDKFNLSIEMMSVGITVVTYKYLQNNLAPYSVFKNDKRGIKAAIEKQVQDAVAQGWMWEVPQGHAIRGLGPVRRTGLMWMLKREGNL